MERYFVKANNLIVDEYNYQHDFLCEMHPVLDELYCKLWFYKNLSIMTDEIKQKKILELEIYIKELLNIYNIPEDIMFIKLGDKYIEPFSRADFKINKKVHMENATQEQIDKYMEENKNNKFLKYGMSQFKQITKTKYKKR